MTDPLDRLATTLTTGPPPQLPALLLQGTVVSLGPPVRVDVAAMQLLAIALVPVSIGDSVYLLRSGETAIVLGVAVNQAAQVGARVFRNSDQGISAATMSVVTHTTVDGTDPYGFWDGGNRLVVPAGHAGRYLALGRIEYDCGAGTMTGVGSFLRDAVGIRSRNFLNMASIGSFSTFETATTLNLVVGGYVELCGYVTSATAATVINSVAAPTTTDAISPALEMWKLD